MMSRINHERRFIFIRTPRCASRTVSEVNECFSGMGHTTLQEYADDGPINGYSVFAGCRNPYDRTLSAFTWMMRHKRLSFPYPPDHPRFTERFREFVQVDMIEDEKLGHVAVLRPQRDYFSLLGEVQVDHLIRYENLLGGVQDMCRMVGVLVPKVLPRWNESGHPPWEMVYDEASKEAVYSFYQKDFEQLRYSR